VKEEHPTPAELEAFVLGNLPADRLRAVILHLVRGCGVCRARVKPFYEAMRGNGGDLTPEEEASYGTAIERAFRAVADKQRQAAAAALSLLTPGELAALKPPSVPLDDLALFETFLQRSWALRHEDPCRMVQFAQFAVFIATNLNPLLYGGKRVLDLQCRAWTELGNAHRVSDDLDQAETGLERAIGLFLRGSRDRLLGARVYDVYASLCADRRRFDLALEAIETVYAIHRERGDTHLAGRALISQGIYTGHKGEQDKAVHLMERGLEMIDDRREPGLAFLAIHNQICFLVEGGRFGEAWELLDRSRERCAQSAGRVSQIKMRWLEGRLLQGLGDLAGAETALLEAKREFEEAGLGYNAALVSSDLAALRLSRGSAAGAETALLEAKQGFETVGLDYSAALVSLDLAALRLRGGSAAAAQRAALEAVEVFQTLEVHEEARAAVVRLESALRAGGATPALLESVSDFLRRAEKDPNLRYEPQGKPS
jgi:tetratricopeptide (TPR) repeat protein